MAIKRPAMYEHNNPNLPFVNIDNVLGGMFVLTGGTSGLTGISKYKLKQWQLAIIESGEIYRLITDPDTMPSTGSVFGDWELYISASGGTTDYYLTGSTLGTNAILTQTLNNGNIIHTDLSTLSGDTFLTSQSFTGNSTLHSIMNDGTVYDTDISGVDTYLNSGTFNPSNSRITLTTTGPNANSFAIDLSSLVDTDTFVQNGVYYPSTATDPNVGLVPAGTIVYTVTNSGGTNPHYFSVTGITSGMTDTNYYSTGGFVDSNSVLTISGNSGFNSYTIDLSSLSNTSYWTSGSTGLHSLRTIGNQAAGGNATGDYSIAEGYNTLASGDYSHAGGYSSIVNSDNGFIHSSGSTLTSGATNSVLLGGVGLTGDAADTVYVPYLNIHNTPNGSGTTLVVDGNGDIYASTANTIDFSYVGLVSPVITHTWNIKDSSGKHISYSTANPLRTVNGSLIDSYITGASTTYKYVTDTTHGAPDSISGDWGSVDPGDGVNSSQLGATNISADTTFKVVFTKAATGYVVDGSGHVVPATGNDTTSDSISIQFLSEVYHGEVTGTSATIAPTISATDVYTQLNGGTLLDNNDFTLNGVTSTPDSGGVYYHHYIAYPVNDGVMVTLVLDGSTSVPIDNVYSLQTITSFTNSVGNVENYYVYVTDASNPYNNVNVTFKHS